MMCIWWVVGMHQKRNMYGQFSMLISLTLEYKDNNFFEEHNLFVDYNSSHKTCSSITMEECTKSFFNASCHKYIKYVAKNGQAKLSFL